MDHPDFRNNWISSHLLKPGLWSAIVITLWLATANGLIFAQDTRSQLEMNYGDNRVSITAKDVDIKRVLAKMAELTGIIFRYPDDLTQEITIYRKEIPLKAAIKSILKGMNHVIIFTGSDKKKARISEVLVYSKKKAVVYSRADQQNLSRIGSYEKQIETYREKLSTLDPGSSRAKSYERRIASIQKRIERLESRLND